MPFTDFFCTSCMTFLHDRPACKHDPATPCMGCGKPRGYRWADGGEFGGPATMCWYCVTGRNRPE